MSRLGFDLDRITAKLQEDGVAAFAESFRALWRAITQKAKTLKDEGKRYA